MLHSQIVVCEKWINLKNRFYDDNKPLTIREAHFFLKAEAYFSKMEPSKKTNIMWEALFL